MEPEWRDRFHRNLNEDSARLAESSKALVTYLDESETSAERRGVPQEEAEAFFAAHGHHFPELEQGTTTPEDLTRAAAHLTSPAARILTNEELAVYVEDAAAMPLEPFSKAVTTLGIAPLELAREFGVDPAATFRRLAAMPETVVGGELGLVICDASGSILFRKPVTGFNMPRHGESCPLWPLFVALNRPLVPIRRRVAQQGRNAAVFECFAVAWPQVMADFEEDPVFRSAMLMRPIPGSEAEDEPSDPVGSSCRVCPRDVCPARREPSILSEGF